MLLLFVALALTRGVVGEESYPAGRISYDGQQVLKCKFNADVMPTIEDSLDVWGVHADGTIDVRAKTPKERALIESLLDGCTVVIEDLEAVVQASDAANLAAREKAPAGWFDAYHTLAELQQYYRDLQNQYPSWVSSVNIGTTANGNTLTVYIINPSRSSNAPIVFLDAGIHAREWIAPATLNYVVDALLTEYNAGNTATRNLMNSMRLYVLPVVNPDGYLFTWSNDRMWRKNRSRYNASTCYGTDNNRNFNSHWNGGGSSNNPCSDTFMGPTVASERETQAIQNYVANIQPSGPFLAYVSYHSYSQLILRPWGWTTTNSPNETYLKTLGDKISTDIRNAVFAKTYVSQKSVQLYVTSGSSADYMYDTNVTNANRYGGRNYRVASYTIELRPSDTQTAIGFQLPPIEILPTGQENYPALKNFLTSVIANPVLNNA